MRLYLGSHADPRRDPLPDRYRTTAGSPPLFYRRQRDTPIVSTGRTRIPYGT